MTPAMPTYTYNRRYAAWLGDEIVTVPDQIAADQRAHDVAGTVFPARLRHGNEVMVRLDGEAYGLHTWGAGDMRVVSCTP